MNESTVGPVDASVISPTVAVFAPADGANANVPASVAIATRRTRMRGRAAALAPSCTT